MRGIDNVSKEFHDKGLRCFGVTTEGPEKDGEIKKTVESDRFSYPTLIHAGEVFGKGKPYPAPVTPTMYIIDRKGVIRVAHAAGITETVVRDDLQKLGFDK